MKEICVMTINMLHSIIWVVHTFPLHLFGLKNMHFLSHGSPSTACTILAPCVWGRGWGKTNKIISYPSQTYSRALKAFVGPLEATSTSTTLHQVTTTSPSSSSVKLGWIGCQPTTILTPRPSTYSRKLYHQYVNLEHVKHPPTHVQLA